MTPPSPLNSPRHARQQSLADEYGEPVGASSSAEIPIITGPAAWKGSGTHATTVTVAVASSSHDPQPWSETATKMVAVTKRMDETTTSGTKPAGWTRRLVVLIALPCTWLWSHGMACGFLNPFVFSLQGLFFKLMKGGLPVLEFLAYRSSIAWVVTVAVAWHQDIQPVYGHAANRARMIVRGGLQAVSLTCYYAGLSRLPLPDAVVISLLHPPLTALLARLFLKEPLGWKGVLGCLLGLSGVFVLARPSFLFGQAPSAVDSGADMASALDHERLVGIGFGVVSSMLMAASNVYYKFVSRSEPALVLALWFHIVTFFLTVIPSAAGWPQPFVVPSISDHILVLGCAASSFMGNLLMSRTFQLLPANTGSMFGFTAIGWAYVYDLAFFHDAFLWTGAVGTLLIALGILVVVLKSQPAAKLPSNAAVSPTSTENSDQDAIKSRGAPQKDLALPTTSDSSSAGVDSGFHIGLVIEDALGAVVLPAFGGTAEVVEIIHAMRYGASSRVGDVKGCETAHHRLDSSAVLCSEQEDKSAMDAPLITNASSLSSLSTSSSSSSSSTGLQAAAEAAAAAATTAGAGAMTVAQKHQTGP